MDEIKKVILVTNSVTEEEVTQVKQALEEARKHNLQIKLSIVHVIPNLPTSYFNIPSMVVLAEQYYDEAKHYLTSIGEALGVPKKEQWLITGRLKTEVLRLCSKLGCDYILASGSNIHDLQQARSLKRDQLKLLFRNKTINSYL